MNSSTFDSLPVTEQRRAIARDVGKQLLDQRMIAEAGVFLRLSAEEGGPTPDQVESLRALLASHKRDTKPCSVCALGGIMLSQLDLNGDSPIAEVDADRHDATWVTDEPTIEVRPFPRGKETNTFSPFMLRYFSREQLQMIEIAYEEGEGCFHCGYEVREVGKYGDESVWKDAVHREKLVVSLDEASAAIAFGKRYKTNHDRLIAIMESIANHPEGLFVPPTQ